MGDYFEGMEEATLVSERREGERIGQVQAAGMYIRRVMSATSPAVFNSMRIKEVGVVQIGHLATHGEIYFVRHAHDKMGAQLGQEHGDYDQVDTYYFVGPDGITVCEDDLSYENSLLGVGLESGTFTELIDWRANKADRFAEYAAAASEDDATALNRLMRSVMKAVGT